ncbi:MAG: hypothetical protein MSD82_05025 [Prevotella sp.]|nr:hypothetical protein [Prevotella sp.]
MARKAEKERTKDGLKLKIVNPNAAGIDIAYGEMQVCVPEDRDGDNNRCSAVSHATTRRLPHGSRPAASVSLPAIVTTCSAVPARKSSTCRSRLC